MPAGRPKGTPRTGGRLKGTRNHATAEIKALVAHYGPKAIKTLAHLAFHAKSDATKVAACKELLDRGFGKAPQPIKGDDEGAPIALTVRWQE